MGATPKWGTKLKNEEDMKEEIYKDLMTRYQMLGHMKTIGAAAIGEEELSGIDMRLLTVTIRRENENHPYFYEDIRYVENEAGTRIEARMPGYKCVQSINENNSVEETLDFIAEALEVITEIAAADENNIIEWNWLGD